jgi:hypothetical protein
MREFVFKVSFEYPAEQHKGNEQRHKRFIHWQHEGNEQEQEVLHFAHVLFELCQPTCFMVTNKTELTEQYL